MAAFPILERGRVADLSALIRHLATCPQEQRYTGVLNREVPNLSTPSEGIVTDHPDLFRVGGAGDEQAISLLFRFLLPERPPLNQNQNSELIASVNRSHEQALAQQEQLSNHHKHDFEHKRYNFEWWKWITSFLTGGVVGGLLLEAIRSFVARK